MKPRPIWNGFSPHDCETWYICPICKCVFGSWTIYHQEKNENGTNEYCPNCHTELNFRL
jgi:hypothetical protein